MARPAEGYRNAKGEIVPGSTTITGRFKDSGPLLYWAHKVGYEQGRTNQRPDLYAKRDEAADIGTYAHEAIEADIHRAPIPAVPSEFSDDQKRQARATLESYAEWRDGHRMIIVATEIPLVSERLQTGGTIDAIGTINDKLSIIDWKSSKAYYPDQLIQLTFYLDLWEEHHPDQLLHGIHILRVGKQGADFSHHFFRRDHPKVELARKLFACYRAAYDLDRELRG